MGKRYLKGERKIGKERILEVLQKRPVITANKLAKTIGVGYYTAKNYLSELAEEGVVTREEFVVNKYTTIVYILKT